MEEIQQFVIYTVHNYMRELLGEIVYLVLTLLLALLGFILFVGAAANSNILLGDPLRRDKSQLSEIEYRKTRTILRFVLVTLGLILFFYNLIGLLH